MGEFLCGTATCSPEFWFVFIGFFFMVGMEMGRRK